MSSRTLLLSLALLVPAPAAAAPECRDLARKMRTAIWPDRPSVRELTITVTSDTGEARRLTAGQARKRVGGKERMATVVLAPPDARGMAWLVEDVPNAPVQWVYIPAVRRVRLIMPAYGYQSFFHSDFTFADVGLIDRDARCTVRGETTRAGVRTWEIEQVPEASWYYGRIVTWVAQDHGLPVERNFYDPANSLWKVERFSDVTVIEGVPTVLRFAMEDRHEGGTSEIRVSEVDYDADVPDALVESSALPRAAASPFWK